MTALQEFQRLEATALWRPTPEDQRREVIVSLGDATLTITETSGRALAHWSLAAVIRANGTGLPAIYHPDGDPGETLELSEDEAEMISAIDKLLRVIDRRRPRPGKLRLVLATTVTLGAAVLAFFWAPGAILAYAVNVVPEVKQVEIGNALQTHLARVTGAPCTAEQARRPLQRLAVRILGPDRENAVLVVPDGVRASAHLPGGVILLGRAIIEDHEDADVPAGYILAEHVRATRRDPMRDLLEAVGLGPTLRLLTTGSLPDSALMRYAEHLLTRAPDSVPSDELLDAFAKAELRISPYAYARDVTGESVLTLIEGDTRRDMGSRLVLSDADWVRLQGICGA